MKYIPAGVSRGVARKVLILQKQSPQLMFGVGIAGAVASTVMACRATLKLSDDLDKMKGEVEQVKERNKTQQPDDHKALAMVYAKNAGHVVKLYGPSLLVGSASIGLLTGSHITLNRRNAGLTAAYAAMSKAYDEYRDRVREELGDEKERDIYHGAIVEKEKVDGKVETIRVVNPNTTSIYSRFFDDGNAYWQKQPELNHMFLKARQNYANHLLVTRGHVFLNEIYDSLGFEHTKEGSVVGWIYDSEGESGDNYIDFGLDDELNARYLNGEGQVVILDFNVDGVIFDRI